MCLAAAVAVSRQPAPPAASAGSNRRKNRGKTSASEGSVSETAESVSAPKETLGGRNTEQAVSDEKNPVKITAGAERKVWNQDKRQCASTIAEEKGIFEGRGESLSSTLRPMPVACRRDDAVSQAR